MKFIPLTRGYDAIVDDEDYDRVNKFKWHVLERNDSYYAHRFSSIAGKRTSLYMHHSILSVPGSTHIDHRDCNGLNNRKYNLRVIPKNSGANSCNSRLALNNTSGFKGVCWAKPQKLWKSQIRVGGKLIFLGYFKDKIEAAKTYDLAAIRHFGDFARTNAIMGLFPLC